MKNLKKKYSFPVLSVVAICSFFIFTGGVLDQNSTLDTPPTITFTAESSNTYKVAEAQTFTVQLTNYDPYQHDVTESCDLIPNVPDKTTQKTDIGSPESLMWIISPGGTDSVKLSYYDRGDEELSSMFGVLYNSNAPDGYGKLIVKHVFSVPGNWKLVCRARTVSRTPAKYVNGTLKSGGEPLLGAWVESSYTITIGGTAPMPVQKYTLKSMEIVPAFGDPTPGKTFTFSDPARQYLDVFSPTKASMKFYWTPAAADLATYPNLASKYELSYQNADYSIDTKGSQNGFYAMTLNFEGQQIAFGYKKPDSKLFFYKPSKRVANGSDQFVFTLN